MKNRQTILYCPLNWGLGHASRGIYLIQKFLDKNYDVVIAADGEPLVLLKKEYPQLKSMEFKSFRVRYTKRFPLMLKLLFYLPVMIIGIAREHRKLKMLIRNHNIDIVVSDNRYGLWSNTALTVILTHQVSIRLPVWLSWLEYPLYRLNYRQLKKFNYVWIPDIPGDKSLSGSLSQKYPVPLNTRFIGILSRFMKDLDESEKVVDDNYDILVILSGPEPQRTVLEHKVCNQLGKSSLKTLIVRGVPSEKQEIVNTGNLTLVSHLPSHRLKVLISSARIIISRAGYSTIMDLIVLKKIAILIPTPGQTEQEYLGRRLEKEMSFTCLNQHNLNLEEVCSTWVDQDIQYSFDNQGLDRAIEDLEHI